MPSQVAELEAPPQEQTRRRPLRGCTPPITSQAETIPQSAREAPERPPGITEETWNRLVPRRRAFVVAYIRDGNALKAYEAAGYALEDHGKTQDYLKRRAYSVLKGKAVRTAILEHKERRDALAEAKKDFALDWIVSEHERLMGIAERAGDYAVATRNLELIGRTRGVYADNVLVDLGQRRQYSETERLEAARLSRLALLDGMGAGNDNSAKALEGDCGPVGGPGEAETAPATDGEGGDSEEHTSDPITSSALPAPPPGDGDRRPRADWTPSAPAVEGAAEG